MSTHAASASSGDAVSDGELGGDILFGLDVESIGTRPYKSVTELEYLDGKRETTALNVRAEELGIRIHPDANVYGGPLIGSHVGADVTYRGVKVGTVREIRLSYDRQLKDVVMPVVVGPPERAALDGCGAPEREKELADA